MLLILLGFARNIFAQDIGGRAQLNFQRTDTEQANVSDFNQNYELRFRKRVTPSTEYRLFVRWQDDVAKTKQENRTDRTQTQLLQPSFDLLYQFSPFDLQAGFELTQTKNKADPGEDHLLQQKRLFSRFSWRPEDLPRFVLQLDRKTNEDKKALVNTDETDLTTTTDYAYKAFKFLHSFQLNQFNDQVLNLTRNEYDNLGRVDYQDNFLRNRLNITGTYLVDYRERIEHAHTGTSISVPVELIPQKGLYSNDDSPLDNTDHPMVNTPSLIDRNLSSSTGINLGTPGGLSFQNIGMDLGRSLSADQIHVYARNSVGGLVPFGGPITWNVYTSSDGVHWTLIAAGASTVFNPTFSRYEISFSPSASAQFFKVVNFGVNSVEAFVTEIQIFGHDTFGAGEKKTTTNITQTGNLTTMVKPLEKVTLTYDGFFNTIKDEPENTPTFTSTEWTQGLSTLIEPFRFFSTTLRYQKRKRTLSEGQDQDSNFSSAVFNLFFLRNLDTSFAASRANEKIDKEKSSTADAFLLHNGAKLYKNWDVSLDLEYNRQKDFQEHQLTDRYSMIGTSFAQLTRNLTWSVNGTFQETSVSNLTNQRTKDTRVTTEFFYRPSQQINLAARWGYLKAEKQSGFLQRYKLDWMPFPDGAIQFTGTYELDRDTTSEQSLDRLSGLLRWNINRNAYWEVNYVKISQKSIETTRTQSIFTTLNLNF